MINSKKNSGNLLISSLTSASWVCRRLTDLFRDCPSVFGSLGTTQQRLGKWSCSNFSWISLEHSPASRPPYLWSISLSGSRKDSDSREGCPAILLRSTNETAMWLSDTPKRNAAGEAEPRGQLSGQTIPEGDEPAETWRKQSVESESDPLGVLSAKEWPRTSHRTSLSFPFLGYKCKVQILLVGVCLTVLL